MNESKDKLSARTKVMDSWNSGWKSISKTPPILPIIDIQMSRSVKANKSDKKLRKDFNKSFDPTKVITKENTLKLLSKNKQNERKDTPKAIPKDNSKDNPKDSSKTNLKERPKELRHKMNAKSIGDKPNDSTEESNHEKSEKSDSKDNTKEKNERNDKNSILSKLRKRKTESKSSTIDTIERHNPLSVTESDNKLENNYKEILIKHNSIEKEINSLERAERTVISVSDNDMDVETTKACIRPNCHRKINRFYLFEEKYCSSDCAIKQWTEEFQSHWALQKTQ